MHIYIENYALGSKLLTTDNCVMVAGTCAAVSIMATPDFQISCQMPAANWSLIWHAFVDKPSAL